MKSAKGEWDKRAGQDAFRHILGTRIEVNETEFDRSGAEDVDALLKGLTGNVSDWVVLDIGCGAGRMEKTLSTKVSDIYAVDVSSGMIDLATSRLEGYRNVHFSVCNGKDLQTLKADMFDLVFSIGAFQHIPRDLVYLAYFPEARRVLRSGGYFRFGVPSRRALFFSRSFWKVVYGYLREERHFSFMRPEGEPADSDYFSSRFYGKDELEMHLRTAGFRDVMIEMSKTKYPEQLPSFIVTAAKSQNRDPDLV